MNFEKSDVGRNVRPSQLPETPVSREKVDTGEKGAKADIEYGDTEAMEVNPTPPEKSFIGMAGKSGISVETPRPPEEPVVLDEFDRKIIEGERKRIDPETGMFRVNGPLSEFSRKADRGAFERTLATAAEMIVGKNVSDVKQLVEKETLHTAVLYQLLRDLNRRGVLTALQSNVQSVLHDYFGYEKIKDRLKNEV